MAAVLSRSPIKQLPVSVWLVELCGVGATIAAGFADGYVQSLGLAVGVALLLAVPLGLVQQSLEQRLSTQIETAISESIAAASARRLSGPAVPMAPEDLDLWPCAAFVEPGPPPSLRLRLRSTASALSSIQPMEVMIVVTDPIKRTFSADRKLQTIVEHDISDWLWPDDFSSGDVRDGAHTVEFFIAPLSAGPARRFGLAASAEFVYPMDV